MKTFLALLLSLTLAIGHSAFGYEPPKPAHPVEILRFEWRDSSRDRVVPVKIYLPKDVAKPAPVILFSHGLGGSREGYEYLGQHWAGCGYVSVHLQHAGSDDAVWKSAPAAERQQVLKAATMNLSTIANRPKDVSFVLDQLTAANSDTSSPLHGRLDLAHVGMAGHSFGGFTTMAIAGEDHGPAQWTDPRVTAAIAMSAPAARPMRRATAYDFIKIPIFYMTGTLDDSPIGESTAADRRVGFDHMKADETCLLTLKGGDHMTFSGVGRELPPGANIPGWRPEARAHDAEFHALIDDASTAFWDAWLKGDSAAHAWLMQGGFEKELGDRGTFEKKVPAK